MSLEEPLSFTSTTLGFKRLTPVITLRWLRVAEVGNQKQYGALNIVSALRRTPQGPERVYAIFKTFAGAKRAYEGARAGTLEELECGFKSAPEFDQLDLPPLGQYSWYDELPVRFP